ncbi:MAG: hypothetical protein HYR51_06245 [Candidatus Rokubacteria bacterium]|nr:hypothetical protein [Candidatus Rokubacteria bacterium]
MIRLALRVAVLVMVALGSRPAPADADPCTGNVSHVFTQPFPSSSAEVTRWSGAVCSVAKHGLVLGITRFRPSPAVASVKMLYDARVSEIYVYYHDGLAFLDIQHYSTGLLPLDTVDCPVALGTRILGGRACLEVRDRGLAYTTGDRSRRGEELVIWGVNRSANYKYVIEWRLRDDGVIVGRVGATGQNLAGHHDVPHVHLITWRLDIDLGGASGDTVREITHVESSSDDTARDTVRMLTVEGGRTWSAAGLRYWRINDSTLQNAQGNPTGLRLLPSRSGTGRHVYPHTMSDVWVTRGGSGKGVQLAADALPTYAADAQSIDGADIVLWYSTPIHHVPRDEDDDPLGATQVMWADVTLVPENLFDASPLP